MRDPARAESAATRFGRVGHDAQDVEAELPLGPARPAQLRHELEELGPLAVQQLVLGDGRHHLGRRVADRRLRLAGQGVQQAGLDAAMRKRFIVGV